MEAHATQSAGLGAMPRETTVHQPLCAEIDGFSMHAAVRVQAHDLKRPEQLCRYITRPALSDERVQVNAAWRAQGNVTRASRNGLKPGDAVQRSGRRAEIEALQGGIGPRVACAGVVKTPVPNLICENSALGNRSNNFRSL